MTPPRGEVLQGTLDLIVLTTLDALGPLHGYGIAQRIQQVSEDLLKLNQGTLYPALLRLDHLEVGRLGQQSQSEILLADALRPETTGRRSGKLGAHGRNHRAPAGRGRRVR